MNSRRLFLAASVIAAALTTTSALAGSEGTVKVLRLGKVNRSNATSELRGATTKPLLRVRNTKAGPALDLVAPAGVAPLTVSSTSKVANLNVDLLDGLDATALQQRVSGTCPSGQAIRVVNSDGTVSCQAVGASAGGAVTSVDSGTGLAGGPITTAGTLSIASPFQLPQSCSSNEVPKSTGSNAWNCAADQNSGGTVTSVDSGTGLSGGPVTTSGALSIASGYRLPQSCSNGQIPKSDGAGAWSCAPDSGATVRVAQGNSVSFTSPVGFGEKMAVSITAPTAGFVLLVGVISVDTFVGGTTSCVSCRAKIRLRDKVNSAESPIEIAGLGAGNSAEPEAGVQDGVELTMTWVFPVTAGARSFALDAAATTSAGGDPGAVFFDNPTLTGLFVPFGSTGGGTLGPQPTAKGPRRSG